MLLHFEEGHMRDNYVGDVGDFYKYSLLRRITGHTDPSAPKQRLGVVWYLYPDPCKETDGLHLDYLSEQKRDKFRPQDPELYDALAQLIQDDARSVQEVERRAILPADTRFYATPLSFAGQEKGTKAAIEQRNTYRQQWLEDALKATEGCDMVFFDPDNGLEVKSTAFHHDKGAKFTFYRELLPFWERGQSLVIYQHKNMHESAEMQIRNRTAELKAHLPGAVNVEHMYYPSYGGRIFFMCHPEG
jgi:hypothetical protein